MRYEAVSSAERAEDHDDVDAPLLGDSAGSKAVGREGEATLTSCVANLCVLFTVSFAPLKSTAGSKLIVS